MILTVSISSCIFCRDSGAELGWAASQELFVLKQLLGEAVMQSVAMGIGWWPLVLLQQPGYLSLSPLTYATEPTR